MEKDNTKALSNVIRIDDERIQDHLGSKIVRGSVEALWGARVSPGTVSNLNKKIYAQIEAWRMRPIEGEHPYLYLGGIVLKRNWAGGGNSGDSVLNS